MVILAPKSKFEAWNYLESLDIPLCLLITQGLMKPFQSHY